jgi:hypothetical protein
VSAVVRAGVARMPSLGLQLEQGDVVRFVVARQAYGRLESFLGIST